MFIAAIRDLNYQASQLQNEENSSVQSQFVETDSNPQCESSAQGGDSISGESKTRTDALFEASVRAVVADPAPNMQSILTWMHSVSTTGALVPIPATTAYLPRGLGQEKPKVSVETNPPNWEGNTISIYTPTQSSLPSAKPNTQNQSQVPSKSNPFNGTNFNLPNSSTNSTVSSFSHRKHPLPNDDDEREIKRRMFERILPTRTPSATDSLCTEDQSLPDDDEN